MNNTVRSTGSKFVIDMTLTTDMCTGYMDVSVAQCSALIDIFNATRGTGWTNTNNR